MAETTISPTTLTANTASVISQGGGTAINTSNTMHFAYPKEGRLLILIDSDHASTSATIGAGAFIAAGKGTSTVAVANGAMSMFFVEGDRHVDEDGEVVITWAADSAGYVRAFYIP